MKCKAGAALTRDGQFVSREIIEYAMPIADKICATFGVEPIATSIMDGTHKVGSLHYLGRAFDLRTRDIVPARREAFRAALRRALGPEYDVVLEDTHIHIEHDAKTSHLTLQQENPDGNKVAA